MILLSLMVRYLNDLICFAKSVLDEVIEILSLFPHQCIIAPTLQEFQIRLNNISQKYVTAKYIGLCYKIQILLSGIVLYTFFLSW